MGDRSIVEESHCKLDATWVALNNVGVRGDHLDRIRADTDHRSDLAEFVKCGRGLRPSIPAELAEEIMGDHFFGPKDWKSKLYLGFSEVQTMKAAWFPWNEEYLLSPCPFTEGRLRKDTHMAFFGRSHVPDPGKERDKTLTIKALIELEANPDANQHLLGVMFSEQRLGFSVYSSEWRDRESTCADWHLVYLGAAQLETGECDLPKLGQTRALKPLGYDPTTVIEQVMTQSLHVLKAGEPHPGIWSASTTATYGSLQKCVFVSNMSSTRGKKSCDLTVESANLLDSVHGVGAKCLTPPPFDPARVKFSY